MDSEKLGSTTDSSSEEQSDRSSDPIKEEDSNSFANKRSYECIFCKRGFTNAQALGGHMNIHRKDRANKVKHITSSSSSSSIPNKQIDQTTFTNISYFEPLLVRSQVNYQASASNAHGYFQELGDLNINMNLGGSDLSLKIGPTKGRRGLWNGEGVDLELRLGHHP